MTKADIRNMLRLKKKSLTREEMNHAAKEVYRRLDTFLPYKTIEMVYCYASYNQELPTKELIKEILKSGRKVALPKVVGEEIKFYLITDYSQVKTGYQGIPEPVTSELCFPTAKKPSLMLLPGLAFTSSGDRLGYGGGFYDRYLATVPKGSLLTCGLGYDFQVLETLPSEERDVPLDYLITPTKVIQCKRIQNVY